MMGLKILNGALAQPPTVPEPVTTERVNETVRQLEAASSDRRLALLALLREWSVRRADARVDPLTLPAALREATLEIAKLAEAPDPAIRLVVLADLGRLRAPGPVAHLVWQKALASNDPLVHRAVAEGMRSYLGRVQEIREPSSGAARLRLLELFAADAAATLDLLPILLRGPSPEARADACRALSAAMDTLDDRQAELASDLNPAAFASFKKHLLPIGEQVSATLRAIGAELHRESPANQKLMLEAIADVAEVGATRAERDSRQRQPRGRLLRADVEPEGAQAAARIRAALRELLPALNQIMATASVETKLVLLGALEDLEGNVPGMWDLLERSSRDSNRFVRWAALRAMAKEAAQDPSLVMPALRRGLFDEDLGVRNATCQTVELFGARAKVLAPDLGKLLLSEDEELQHNVVRALSAMGREAAPAVPQLVLVLKSRNPKLRQVVPPLLAIIGQPAAHEAIPALRAALTDSDPEVRVRAAEALRKLTE
jgi:HEAT repeat protein